MFRESAVLYRRHGKRPFYSRRAGVFPRIAAPGWATGIANSGVNPAFAPAVFYTQRAGTTDTLFCRSPTRLSSDEEANHASPEPHCCIVEPHLAPGIALLLAQPGLGSHDSPASFVSRSACAACADILPLVRTNMTSQRRLREIMREHCAEVGEDDGRNPRDDHKQTAAAAMQAVRPGSYVGRSPKPSIGFFPATSLTTYCEACGWRPSNLHLLHHGCW